MAFAARILVDGMTVQRQRLNLKFTVADTDQIGSMSRAGYTVPQIADVMSGGEGPSRRGRRNVTEIEVETILHELGLTPRYARARA
jgi:hypothetical protein